MERIPFFKASIGEEEIEEVAQTLRSGWLTTGVRTKQFEADFAAYIGQTHAVAVNSCTAALHLALEAIGLQAGEGVLVPTMTFAATAEVVRYFGAVPILVDCREADFNLDVADAEVRLQAELARGRRVRAIIPVHYGGQIGDVAGVTALAQRHGLKIIEDAAHCCPAHYRLGATEPWRSVGHAADITCFSFYANKCITTGEGGMACTQNAAYADRMRLLSLHGISRDAWKRFSAEGTWYYEILAPGYKYNLTDIASAIGLHQLKKSEAFHQARSARAAYYTERLRHLEELILPHVDSDRIHSWHLYPLRVRTGTVGIGRNELIVKLGEAGIGTSVHYIPLHMHPYYRDNFGYRPEDLPRMAAVYPELITLPLFAELTEAQQDHICATLESLIGQFRKSSK